MASLGKELICIYIVSPSQLHGALLKICIFFNPTQLCKRGSRAIHLLIWAYNEIKYYKILLSSFFK